MKKVYYTFNMDIEAIPVNYLPNILKSENSRNNYIFQMSETGMKMFSTIVEDLNPHYFKKLSTFDIMSESKGIINIIAKEDVNNFLIIGENEYREWL